MYTISNIEDLSTIKRGEFYLLQTGKQNEFRLIKIPLSTQIIVKLADWWPDAVISNRSFLQLVQDHKRQLSHTKDNLTLFLDHYGGSAPGAERLRELAGSFHIDTVNDYLMAKNLCKVLLDAVDLQREDLDAFGFPGEERVLNQRLVAHYRQWKALFAQKPVESIQAEPLDDGLPESTRERLAFYLRIFDIRDKVRSPEERYLSFLELCAKRVINRPMELNTVVPTINKAGELKFYYVYEKLVPEEEHNSEYSGQLIGYALKPLFPDGYSSPILLFRQVHQTMSALGGLGKELNPECLQWCDRDYPKMQEKLTELMSNASAFHGGQMIQVVGMSLGAGVAARVVSQYMDLVSRVALISPAGMTSEQVSTFNESLYEGAKGEKLLIEYLTYRYDNPADYGEDFIGHSLPEERVSVRIHEVSFKHPTWVERLLGHRHPDHTALVYSEGHELVNDEVWSGSEAQEVMDAWARESAAKKERSTMDKRIDRAQSTAKKLYLRSEVECITVDHATRLARTSEAVRLAYKAASENYRRVRIRTREADDQLREAKRSLDKCKGSAQDKMTAEARLARTKRDLAQNLAELKEAEEKFRLARSKKREAESELEKALVGLTSAQLSVFEKRQAAIERGEYELLYPDTSGGIYNQEPPPALEG